MLTVLTAVGGVAAALVAAILDAARTAILAGIRIADAVLASALA